MNNIHQHRNHEAHVITTVLALICAAACATSVVPGLEGLITRVLIGTAVLAVLVVPARLGARWVRERREDRQDALAAAIWRAENAASHVAFPHPADNPTQPARLHVVGLDERGAA